MKTLKDRYSWFNKEEQEEKEMKNYEFMPDSIIRNGVTTPAGYSVTPKGTVVVITMNENRERIRLEPGDEYYHAALDAASGKRKPERKKVERAETIPEPAKVERIETIPEPEEKKAPKQARGPVPEKKFIGETIQGNGWKIYFDGTASRTRVIFDADPTERVKKIVSEAGFYYSSVMNSYNKKLTFKAYRAAGELAKKLNEYYKNAA